MKNVLVMGAPRTGTSMVTKVLSEHGWDIGDRCRNSLAHRDPSCYEDPTMVQTNYQIFSSNEAHPMMPCDHVNAAISAEALEILTEDKKEPWVIKDPSLSVTYPFWRQHFPGCHVVATLRHPVPAIESMMKRSHFPHHRFPQVWWRYTHNVFAWGEIYNNVSWVHFPTLQGMESAVSDSGGQYDSTIYDRVFDSTLVHGTPQEMEGNYSYMEHLYSKIFTTKISKR